MFHSLDVSTSALVAQRHRMDTIAANIANLNTTRNENGEATPFQRRLVSFQAKEMSGGEGLGVAHQVEIDDESPPRKVYQPTHPDADADGNVLFPNINQVTEFVNALEAGRAYEANIAAIEMAKQMMQQTLRILA
jgi:flagellar basal-body rod protein FlgC